MFCLNCGKELPDEAKFCSGCGKQIETKEEEIINTVPVCSSCGEKLVQGNKFCIKCGQRIEENKSENGQTVNELKIFTPTAPFWLSQLPKGFTFNEDAWQSIEYYELIYKKSPRSPDTYVADVQALTMAINKCPLILNYYWERGLYLSLLTNCGWGLQSLSKSARYEFSKIVIEDMTTLINNHDDAIPDKEGSFFYLIGAGVLYYLRGLAQMELNFGRKNKEMIIPDFVKALELGIGYNGELFKFINPHVEKPQTEEENARNELYYLEKGFFKSLLRGKPF